MEKTYVIILIILLGGVAQYNISDGDRISQQYLHELNIRVFAFSPKNTTIGLHLWNTKEPTNNH